MIILVFCFNFRNSLSSTDGPEGHMLPFATSPSNYDSDDSITVFESSI